MQFCNLTITKFAKQLGHYNTIQYNEYLYRGIPSSKTIMQWRTMEYKEAVQLSIEGLNFPDVGVTQTVLQLQLRLRVEVHHNVAWFPVKEQYLEAPGDRLQPLIVGHCHMRVQDLHSYKLRNQSESKFFPCQVFLQSFLFLYIMLLLWKCADSLTHLLCPLLQPKDHLLTHQYQENPESHSCQHKDNSQCNIDFVLGLICFFVQSPDQI